MELEDLFKDKRNKQGSRYQNHGHNFGFGLAKTLFSIKNNKNLKRLLIFAVFMILLIVLTLIIVLMPLILKLVDFISQNGLQGLLDYLLGIVDKIWKAN